MFEFLHPKGPNSLCLKTIRPIECSVFSIFKRGDFCFQKRRANWGLGGSLFRLPLKTTSRRAIPTLHTHELTTVTTWHGKGKGSGYSAGSTELLWDTQRDTRRDPLASRSGGVLVGIHWRAALAGYSAGSTELLWDTQRDTRRDPLASRSGGVLGGIHCRSALAGYSAGSTGELL